MLTQGTRYEVYTFVSSLDFSHFIPVLFSVLLGLKMRYLFYGESILGNSIGLLSVLTIEYLGLCSDRSPFDPYDLHIRLNDVHLNKIHLVLGIPSFLDLFD